MQRNHVVKTRKNKKAPILTPEINSATLNVVTFSFRVHENPIIHSRGVDWVPPELENKEIRNK